MIIDKNPRIVMHDNQARELLLKGAEHVFRAVKSTLGPSGRHVVIDRRPKYELKITKDGVTVARHIHFENPVINTGAEIFKEAALGALSQAGDGTTSATVIGWYLMDYALKEVKSGFNPIQLINYIEKEMEVVKSIIKNWAIPLKSKEDLKKIACISTNSDLELGNLIGDIIWELGTNGSVIVEDSNNKNTTYNIIKGYRYGQGFMSGYMVNDTKNMKWRVEDAYVMLAENNISSINAIEQIIRYIGNNPLIIIATSFSDQAIREFSQWAMHKTANICLVIADSYGDYRRARLKDIATYTNAKVYSKNGYDYDTDPTIMLGTAKKVIVSEGETIIINKENLSKEYIEKKLNPHIQEIKEELSKLNNEFDINMLKERLSNLEAGTAIIYVGGESKLDIEEKKDRIDDAVKASKCALRGGFLPGGGITLAQISQALINKADDAEKRNISKVQKAAIHVICAALLQPMSTIFSNAGLNGAEMVERYLTENAEFRKNKDNKNKCLNKGIEIDDENNFLFVDYLEKGIIDPVEVIITSLEKGLHIAKIFTTLSSTINYDIQAMRNTVNLRNDLLQ